VDANAYWYGSPPSGPFNDFEPDPGAIPGYKGGAVWLDSAALPDGAPIIPNSGLEIEKTIGGFGPESLSFFMATEVTSRGQAKGNPGAMFLSTNGVQINGNAPDGAFESAGPNPQFAPGSFIYVDFLVPLEEVRAETERIVRASEHWDCRVFAFQVTDVKPDCVEICILASAINASVTFDLRCEILEQLLSFLQARYPGAFRRLRTLWSRSSAGRLAGTADSQTSNLSYQAAH
jgi:hypothetical protein